MIIRMFSSKAAPVPAAPVEPVPDHAKARNLIEVSIDRLRSRADFLQANIERDSAELRETDRTLEALLEAKAKVAPDLDETVHCTLLAELGEFSEAAE